MKYTAISALLAYATLAGAASASTAQDITNQCIVETRAGGAFSVSSSGGVPQVSAGEGATLSGAHNVNDCIKDKYAVQYATGTGLSASDDGDTDWYSAVHFGGCSGGVMWGGNGYCFKR
jgi:hypothetical protein